MLSKLCGTWDLEIFGLGLSKEKARREVLWKEKGKKEKK